MVDDRWIPDPQGRADVEKVSRFLKLPIWKGSTLGDFRRFWNELWAKIDENAENLTDSNESKLDKGGYPGTAKDLNQKIEDVADEVDKKLDKGDYTGNAENLYNLIVENTGIEFDEKIKYLNDDGEKIKGKCYLDRNTKGIFECIATTTTTVNDARYFKNISNKKNSDRLDNPVALYSNETLFDGNTFDIEITLPNHHTFDEILYLYVSTEVDFATSVDGYYLSVLPIGEKQVLGNCMHQSEKYVVFVQRLDENKCRLWTNKQRFPIKKIVIRY